MICELRKWRWCQRGVSGEFVLSQLRNLRNTLRRVSALLPMQEGLLRAVRQLLRARGLSQFIFVVCTLRNHTTWTLHHTTADHKAISCCGHTSHSLGSGRLRTFVFTYLRTVHVVTVYLYGSTHTYIRTYIGVYVGSYVYYTERDTKAYLIVRTRQLGTP